MNRIAFALVLLAACGDDGGSSSTQDAGADTTTANTTTAVTAMFATTATLNQAWFGVSPSDNTLYVEVDLGGPTTCPEENSPTPTYSLVMGSVPTPSGTSAVTASGAMLDYSPMGDLLGGPPVKSATMSIMLTPDASNADAATAPKLGFDITGTFTGGGTVAGHLYATHCASMDENLLN